MIMRNVENVYKDGLCCSCGICIGTCPVDAISYDYDIEGFIKPVVSEKCINCGKCESCCPGKEYYLKSEVASIKYHTLYSKDNESRKNAASGGLVTEMLCYLLKEKRVDYCVVIPTVKNSLRVKPIITDDIAEVKNASGSKYITVEYGVVIEEIKKNKDKKYAMVCLPCQEHAIKEYLGDNINRVWIITLMCNHVSGGTATRYLLDKNGISDDYEVKYRGNGWPGNMSINDKNIGGFRKLYSEEFGKYFFNFRCKLCDNHFGKESKITVGDPYYLTSETQGCSFCIVRDLEVEKVLQEMLKREIIGEVDVILDSEKIEDVYRGIYVAENNISTILKIRSIFLKKNPKGVPIFKRQKKSFKDIYLLLHMYWNKVISLKKSKKISRGDL